MALQVFHALVTSKDLKLATKSGGSWGVPDTIDSTGNVGSYCCLALDSQGNPGISYYDETNGNLKYAYKSGGTWSKQTVVANDDVGMYSSLDFTSNDKAVISYYDVTRGDLWVAKER